MVMAVKKELISEIFWERWYELSCEGHEFFDMRRRGAQFIVDNLIKPVNAFLKEPFLIRIQQILYKLFDVHFSKR